MELGSECLKNLLPFYVRRQTSARCAADTMLAVQLDIQRIESVATRRKSDTNAVVEVAALRIVRAGFVL